ncbi:MAG: transposase, partial [Bacillus sp. (in: firmicutes)]
MHDEIAYFRLIRKTIRGKVKYYLQLVMKGIPPQKREITEGEVGLDMLEKEKRMILRKMDRSRRASNHNKYIGDGTIKKGNKERWIQSKRYWKLLFELKETCRKLAEKR